MFVELIYLLLLTTYTSSTQPTKCDQTPPQAVSPEPVENKDLYHLTIANADRRDNQMYYTPDQTYVLTLSTDNVKRPFRWFMITADDPEVDNSIYDYNRKIAEVGSLKTLDKGQSRYSERCENSVENYDNSDKIRVEIHWVSPKNADKVRIRATVAENNEVWCTGENLTIILSKDERRSKDTPPNSPMEVCKLCSEARYEVIFSGMWSRMSHPRHYPSKPDENGYTHMVGASHAYHYSLWEPGTIASPGLKLLAEKANTTLLEREIINAMSVEGGTRTLIRGKRRHHPDMFKPSHSLFRVDNIHHLFSIVVGLRPSPDWFLGTFKFELCTEEGWLDYFKMPLYPWDAGTMDGVSYESPKSTSDPVDNVERVEVGSFNAESPFYQMNLNDLFPFAEMEVRRLDVYPWNEDDCPTEEEEEEAEPAQDEPQGEPLIAETRQKPEAGCNTSEWGEWSPCVPDVGSCGIGAQTRTKDNSRYTPHDDQNELQMEPPTATCQENESTEIRHCYVEC